MLEDLVVIDTDEPDQDAQESRLSWRERLGALDERYPRLSRWLGGRLDIEVPAVLASFGFHLALLLGLGTVGYAVHKEAGRQFEATTGALDTAIPDLERSQFQDLDQSADRPSPTAAAGSFAPTLSTVTVQAVPSAGGTAGSLNPQTATPASLAKLDVRRATEAVVPTASLYGQNVSIQGNGAEHVGSAEGAVDRIAEEILRRLEKGRTLVVWAFDASLSLQVERQRLAKHIETVYAHISQLDEKSLAGDGGLLTGVVAFGQGRKAMTNTPTADLSTIGSAIRDVPADTTGIESTFQTVAQIVETWGRYKDARGNRYRTVIIVVTDEVGDDEPYLERAIDAANRARVPVYVLGSQAIFARSEGRMDYTDPRTGQTFYNLPVRQGPESIMPEQIRLPFWYEGDQYDVLDSGFGPFALSRLAGATGGIYFVTRLGQSRMGFDPVAMREYKPDWLPQARYESEVMSRPVRRAVIEASKITQESNLPGMPSLVFPPADAPEFKEAMERNQAIAARSAYTVDAALEPINAVVKLRDRETSRRWQAHYDLIRGRLLAAKVRSYEYNWACAKMKKDAPKLTKPGMNAWRLVPDTVVHYSDKAAAAGKQANDLLKKVVAEHPNTPWALLAQRDLKDPLGFHWTEANVPPIKKNEESESEEAAQKKAKNMPKPPEPPKL
ncbi:MAG: VWA domain-containing protein [Isosphaeraceae bacterium]